MPPAPIADRVLRITRAYIERELPSDRSGELAEMDIARLLVVYGTWRGRFIPQRTRTVHFSRELAESLDGSHHEAAVRAIRAEFETGDDLTPRLSEDVLIAYVPDKRREKKGRDAVRDIDTMLAHDGLHHLHLGTGSGRFVPRGRYLLFVAVRDDDAYFVGVYPHGEWGRLEVLERIVRNWPGAKLLQKFDGLTPVDQPSDEERWEAMQAGLLQLVGIDGAAYLPPGQTSAGTPIDVTSRTHEFLDNVDALREHGLKSWLKVRNGDLRLYWNPAVHNEHAGLWSSQGFLALGRLS